MSKKFYVTTPIYYISGKPHIGHLYTSTAADILKRYHASRGEETLFSTGSDENSQKVVLAAENQGIPVKEYVDKEADKWIQYFSLFHISYDRFIRTTDEDHNKAVAIIMDRLFNEGFVYKGKYEGWYCVDCESFWTDKEVEDGHCPECHREIKKISEENYFFKLSAFQDQLLSFYEDNPKAIEPGSRYNEVVSMIKGGLHDISISRNTQDWGIRLPFDKKHVLWVWFDALINYLTVAGFNKNEEQFLKWWPADCHLMSKDIIRFHCVIWPAMLMALGLEPAHKVFVHGWWLTDGEKMSKSKGNVVNPTEVLDNLCEKTGIDKDLAADVLRWFMFKETTFGEDAVFSMDRLLDRYNYDLANDLGNLVNRVSAMNGKYFDGIVPDGNYVSDEVEKVFADYVFDYIQQMDHYHFKEAIETTWKLIRRCNKLIEEQKPWELVKQDKQESLKNLLYTLLEGIRIASLQISPFMPTFSERVLESFDQKMDFDYTLRYLKIGIQTTFPKVLFPRVKKEKKQASPKKETEKKKPAIEQTISECSIDDFAKFDFRVATIDDAKPHPNADRLLVLQVLVGETKKQIVAGIAKYYKPEELIGKKVLIVNNLKPVELRGEKSEGMVMCASNKKGLCVMSPEDCTMESGTKVK